MVKRAAHNKQRGMMKRMITGKKPMSEEQKAINKKARAEQSARDKARIAAEKAAKQ